MMPIQKRMYTPHAYMVHIQKEYVHFFCLQGTHTKKVCTPCTLTWYAYKKSMCAFLFTGYTYKKGMCTLHAYMVRIQKEYVHFFADMARIQKRYVHPARLHGTHTKKVCAVFFSQGTHSLFFGEV